MKTNSRPRSLGLYVLCSREPLISFKERCIKWLGFRNVSLPAVWSGAGVGVEVRLEPEKL